MSNVSPAVRFAAVAACSILGLVEWLIAPGGEAFTRTDAVAVLLIIGFYGTLGLGLAVGSGIVDRVSVLIGWKRALTLEPVALSVATILFLAAAAAPSRLGLLAAAGLGLAAYLVVARLAGRFPSIRSPFVVWSVHAVLLAATLAGLGLRDPDSVGSLLAAAAVAVAVALTVFGVVRRRSGGRGAAWSVLAAHGFILAGLVFVATRAPVAEADSAAEGSSPAVLLITIDTLRADHVGVYGHPGARTPNIDTLAGEGTLFQDAVAHSPWTGPSHTTILTGLLPQTHGVKLNKMPVPGDVITLVADLRDHGYVTGAFVSGFPLEEGSIRLAWRFHQYDDDLREFTLLPEHAYRVTLFRYLRALLVRRGVDFSPLDRDATAVTDAGRAWLERNGNRPFLAWVHFYGPHLPYTPPEEYVGPEAASYEGPADGRWYALDASEKAAVVADDEAVEFMRSLYDAEIAYVDREIGRLLEVARRVAPPAGLVVVLTSDHGESMGEHGLFFYRDVYEASMRVPLIVATPENPGDGAREIGAQVRLSDVAPTILELLGIDADRPFDGKSLVDLMSDRTDLSPGPAVSVADVEPALLNRTSYALRADGWKLIHRVDGWNGAWWNRSDQELYNLASDPREERDLIHEEPGIASRMEEALLPVVKMNTFERPELTPEEIERLRALGYLQ